MGLGVGVVVVHSIQLEKLVVPNGEDFNYLWQKMQNSLIQVQFCMQKPLKCIVGHPRKTVKAQKTDN